MNGIEITPETILKTREHFIAIEHGCIAEATSGKVRVNDLQRYVAWCESNIVDIVAGQQDHTFTFRQRAYWIQTGESIPLLS